MQKTKCWEFCSCREKDCPAYHATDLNCWLFSSTHCHNQIQGKFIEKIEICLECQVFNANVDTLSEASRYKGHEIILVAEDNTDVRKAEKEILTESGYTVIESEDGEDAIRKFSENGNKKNIDLLILDVIMPKKNGKEAYDAIRKENPHVKVIFTSGYTADIIQRRGILEEGSDFILKPFLPHKLLEKVRTVLDSQCAE
jgi:CheY-like chemotaxis protein